MTTYFNPQSEEEHERAGRGENSPDYCSNCRRAFLEHHNGICPEDWQEDYDPDTGMTAVCPRCESTEVETESDSKTCTSVFHCTSCDHRSESW